MATNLRLRRETETALRLRSETTGRSQQEIIREALDQFLGLTSGPDVAPGSVADLIARGVLIASREPYRRPQRRLALPEGVTSIDLLDRDDRF